MRRAATLGLALAALAGCKQRPAAAPRGPALAVPRLQGELRLDGEPDEAAWRSAARTGALRHRSGQPARPYSEARLLWDERRLYLLLYAADDDIRRDDAFSVAIGPEHGGPLRRLRFAAAGSAEPGVELARSRDGTLDDARDHDEEWVVEAAIPLASLGLTGRAGGRARLELERCDRLRDGTRACGAWGEASGGGLVELAR